MRIYIVMRGDGADKYPDSAWSSREKAVERISAIPQVENPWPCPIVFEVDGGEIA